MGVTVTDQGLIFRSSEQSVCDASGNLGRCCIRVRVAPVDGLVRSEDGEWTDEHGWPVDAHRYLQGRAHAMTSAAIASGELTVGACEQAGEACNGKIAAHHDDYIRPLHVRWLCARHHKQQHAGPRADPIQTVTLPPDDNDQF
jgi:hypothetical protein